METKAKRHDFRQLSNIIKAFNHAAGMFETKAKLFFESIVIDNGTTSEEGFPERRHDVIIWREDDGGARWEAVREVEYNTYENIDEVERRMEQRILTALVIHGLMHIKNLKA